MPTRSRLRRPYPQGRETGRSAGAGADEIRDSYQPQDRESARPQRAADAARPRRRGDRVRRREFISLLGGAAAAWPLTARAQQTDPGRRIGFLTGGSSERDAEWQAFVAAFKEGLQKLGWTEGHNVRIELRWPGADADRRRAYAAELVNLKPDVIVAGGTRVAVIYDPTLTANA